LTRVLVTGVTGQDGTLLARRLRAAGDEVHGVSLTGGAPPTWTDADTAGVTVHIGDVADGARVAEVIAQVEPDEIYHLAGQTSVAASWDDPVGTLRSTGLGAVFVFEAAHRLQDRTGRPVRVVQASSAEMFGQAEQTPQDEDTPIRPASPYGVAKAMAHQMAGIYRSRGLFVATCILYNHESPLRPPTFVTRKITAAAARIAVDGGGTLAMGNLDASRDWGWAPDYVDAMVRAARHDAPEDFIVATGRTHTVEDFVRIAFASAGINDWRPHIKVDPRFVRPVDAAVQIGNAGKAEAVLGWRAATTFEEIVRRMVEHDLELTRNGTPEAS